jgi:hypothetical protein
VWLGQGRAEATQPSLGLGLGEVEVVDGAIEAQLALGRRIQRLDDLESGPPLALMSV